MEMQQLSHFISAVTLRNLGRAAEACHISQPAISRSIRRLEKGLGSQLLQRSARGVVPTDAGRVLFTFAQQVVRDTRLVQDRISVLAGTLPSAFRIGISSNFAHPNQTMALASITRRWPDRRITIYRDFHSLLYEKLVAGDIDLIIGLIPQNFSNSGLVVEPLMELSGALLVGPHHPLARKRRCSVTDLVKYKWITPDLGLIEPYLERRFAKFKMQAPESPLRTNSSVLMKELLIATTMIGLAPSHAFAEDVATGSLVEIQTALGPILGQAAILYAKQSEGPPHLPEFVAELKRICASSRSDA